MTSSEIAARLIDALETAADREAGLKTALVSVSVDMLGRCADGGVSVSLSRKTRSLVFLSAEFVSSSGARIAAASSVHKLTAAG